MPSPNKKPIALTDPRLVRRHQFIQELAAKAPDTSFPEMMGDDAALEACYRFFDNPRVSLDALLEPHYLETVEKAAKHRECLFLHDSSWLVFEGEDEREGLGRVGKGKKREGFLGHFTLACTADGRREPLGLVAVSTHVFTDPTHVRGAWAQRLHDPNRKSTRWGAAVSVAEERMAGRVTGIHVMDREADDYALFEQFHKSGIRHVVRLRLDRLARAEDGVAFEALKDIALRAPVKLEREVPLSPRAPKRFGTSRNEKVHPIRDRRVATLQLRAARVTIRRPSMRRDCREPELTVNIVQVSESTQPEGDAPIDWLLVTSEPVETSSRLEAVVDAYRARWLIEEYFMALKTGCAYERRQLETFARLENALGVLAPVAVGLLRLRHLGTNNQDAPASTVLNQFELAALKHLSQRPLPPRMNAGQALLAVAALGGHLKRNGRPGWRTLYRGYEKLRLAADVWAVASRTKPQRSDQ